MRVEVSDEWCEECDTDITVEVQVRRTYWSQVENEWSFACPNCGHVTEGVG